MFGVDPTIFRRYLKEAEDDDVPEDEANEAVSMTKDKRTEVIDYKMPRRKTTRRKKGRKQSIGEQDWNE